MNVATTTVAPNSLEWQGPGAPDRPKPPFTWKGLLWSMVFPPRHHRTTLTVPGLFLIVLSMGIGSAAYNTASNILFITLSLLLACLLLSGLLSWFNFTGVCWRLRPTGAWRAGHETFVTAEACNNKKWLPTYGLWFDFAAQPRPDPAAAAETEGMRVKDVLAAAEKAITRGRAFMRERLEPGGRVEIEWVLKPDKRGEWIVELSSVGSYFPFGFLRKNIGSARTQTVLVWPAQVDYQSKNAMAAHAGSQGLRTARAGTGDDLLALRKYETGDSHRLIHWKASARLRQLMVRQFAAESHDGFDLWIDTPESVWTRPEQFELLCSFAATLAEDLFAGGRLRSVSVNGGPVRETRRLRDVEAFLDALAVLKPVSRDDAAAAGERESRGVSPGNKNVITFAPEGMRGVSAYVNGTKTASA